MFLFSQGKGGSERLSGLPKFTQQINSHPWIQTWVCSTLRPVLSLLCLYHIAVVLTPGLDSWPSAWALYLGLWCYCPVSSWIAFLLSFPGVHHPCVLSSLLRCSPIWPLETYSTHLLLIGSHGSSSQCSRACWLRLSNEAPDTRLDTPRLWIPVPPPRTASHVESLISSILVHDYRTVFPACCRCSSN